jgi:poly(A) polymerase
VQPVILPRNQHEISRKQIDPDALKVMYRLHRNRYRAYLVGGAVRDLLLKRTPKDYDIATNARPNKVKKLFRNSFLVGRRFRLVHVKFKEKVIEVSTFRRTPNQHADVDGDLLLRRENTFGSPEEDALRRDFTVNGLFYNIHDFSIIDYVGGLSDIRGGLIRTIGDPNIRFREDPARVIRAIRVAARIGFRIEKETWNAIDKYRDEVLRCAPPRILEEIYHLMKYGAAGRSVRLLHKSRLMATLMPDLHAFCDSESGNISPYQLVDQMDNLPAEHPFRTPPVMLAAIFYPFVDHASNSLTSGEDLRERVESCFRPFAQRFNLPRRHFDRLTQICIAQRWFGAKRNRRFKPTVFIKRNFFGEALTVAGLRMHNNGQLWAERRQYWKDMIRQSDIPSETKMNLIETLSNNN